jgi:hypothetical protein
MSLAMNRQFGEGQQIEPFDLLDKGHIQSGWRIKRKGLRTGFIAAA